jgi:D-alanyl-lipoteichoic acid acyltransferase DltB (MBOAT superfamily)
MIFNNSAHYSGITLFYGALFFTFQIYCDFSGYSDIALGTARLFGIDLLRNFSFPYFSRDIAEFWRRWHISLSSWFRDYLYIPLGGSKGGTWMKVRNTFIIFIVSGFWHGANWTFIAWGLLNATYIMPSIILKTNRNNLDIIANNGYLPTLKEFLSMVITFFLTVIAWIFFRSASVSDAFFYISNIFSNHPGNNSEIIYRTTYPFIGILIIMEWINRRKEHGLKINNYPTWLRWSLYLFFICIIVLFGEFGYHAFIYFQF